MRCVVKENRVNGKRVGLPDRFPVGTRFVIEGLGGRIRVQTQLDPIGDEGGEHNGGEKVAGELVISGSDAPEILEPAEAAFDDVAPFVGTLAEGVEGYSVGLVRNDRARAAAFDVGAEGVAVIALVADEG